MSDLESKKKLKFSKFETVWDQCEREAKDSGSFRETLKIMNSYIKKVIEESPEKTVEDVTKEIMADLREYLFNISSISIKYNMMEYYLRLRMNSMSGYNFEKAYKDVYEAIEKGKVDLSKENLSYVYDFEQNMRTLVLSELLWLRESKSLLEEKYNNEPFLKEMITVLRAHQDRGEKIGGKLLNSLIKRITTSEASQKDRKDIKEELDILLMTPRTEKEFVKKGIEERTKESLKRLKEECINEITQSIRILNKFGLLNAYIDMNNRFYNSIFIRNYEYTYEEVGELLSEDKLKKLSAEQLIGLASFWSNRVNKIFQDINKAAEIIQYPELCEYIMGNLAKECGTNDLYEERIKGILVSKSFLHKMWTLVLDKLYEINGKSAEDKTNKDSDVLREDTRDLLIQVYMEYGIEYCKKVNQYLPTLASEEILLEEMAKSFLCENAIYNTYEIKNANMETILISLLHSNFNGIENFGYIREDDGDIARKKYVLVGIDIPKMNMPIRLHISKEMLTNVLRGAQEGSTMFPVYRCSRDFMVSSSRYMSTRIYIPVTEERTKRFKELIEKNPSAGNTENTREHMLYIFGGGKMPPRIRECTGRRYIDIANAEDKEKTKDLSKK